MLHRSLIRTRCVRFSATSPHMSTASRAVSIIRVSDVLSAESLIGSRVTLHGWVRTARLQKRFGFVELNDGSCAGNLQVVWPVTTADAADGTSNSFPSASEARLLTTGASIRVSGTVVASPAAGQRIELAADSVRLDCSADAATYPLQKKAHSAEFLREMVHLRARSAATGAVLRVRAALSGALHAHLEREGLFHIHTPVLTGNDCEGAGELFSVEAASASSGSLPFFGRRVFLTVSGQLHLEAFAAALSRVYAFGPTFRAENSNTPRHLAEFWMLEPEIAPARLDDAMALASSTLASAASSLLNGPRSQDISLLARENATPDLTQRLERASTGDFPRMTYDEALSALSKADASQFAIPPPMWGGDLSGEHERWLAARANGPLFISNYPATLKPFYMSLNESNTSAAVDAALLVAKDPAAANAARITVSNFDLVVPGLGELAGGSAREERTSVLAAAMHARGLLTDAAASPDGQSRPPADTVDGSLDWYLDLRRYGGVKSAGFGMGFDRLVTWCTGIENVRDAVPVPRVVGASGCRM